MNNNEKKKEINNNNIENKNINNNNLFDEYNLNSKIDGKTIKMHFKYPPLIGLENLDNSSYMNATLQCFCNIEKFIVFLNIIKILFNLPEMTLLLGIKL